MPTTRRRRRTPTLPSKQPSGHFSVAVTWKPADLKAGAAANISTYTSLGAAYAELGLPTANGSIVILGCETTTWVGKDKVTWRTRHRSWHELTQFHDGLPAVTPTQPGSALSPKGKKSMTDLAIAPTATIVTLDAANLKAALARVKPYVSSRSGMLPILRCIRITGGDGAPVRILATNLDTTTSVPLTATTDGLFEVAVKYDDFKTFVDSRTKGDTIELTENDGQLVATVGETNARFPVKPVDEFPRLHPDLLGALPAGHLIDIAALADVAGAASTDDNRPILTGVYLHDATVAATDSYRLYVIDDLSVTWPEKPVIIPAKVVIDAAKHGAVSAAIVHDGHDLLFRCNDGSWICTRTIDGEFPNFRGLIPSSYPTILQVPDINAVPKNLKQLAWAIRDAAPVRLTPGDGGPLRFLAVTQDVGTSDTVAGIEGDLPCTVAYNPEYFGELFKKLDYEGPVTLELIDALKPAVLRAKRTGGGDYKRLIMPVRVS